MVKLNLLMQLMIHIYIRSRKNILLFPEMRVTKRIFTQAAANFFLNVTEFI